MLLDRNPRLIGRQLAPASSLRKTPAAEIAPYMRAGVAGVEENCMQAHAAGAGLPRRAGRVLAQRRELFPVAPAVARPKERRIFDACIQQIGVVQRGLEMPDACELPWMRRAVVPCVRSGFAVVDELVADRLPRRAAIIRTLNELPKPTRRLRGVDSVRIRPESLSYDRSPNRRNAAPRSSTQFVCHRK